MGHQNQNRTDPELPKKLQNRQILKCHVSDSVVDPDSLNPDPAIQGNSDPDPGF
jgi:hypothetical protein